MTLYGLEYRTARGTWHPATGCTFTLEMATDMAVSLNQSVGYVKYRIAS